MEGSKCTASESLRIAVPMSFFIIATEAGGVGEGEKEKGGGGEKVGENV